MTTEHDLIQSLTNALEVLYKEAVTAPYSQTLVIGGIAHPIPIGNDLLARDAIYADLLFRARAYLAQPEPEVPTDEPLGDLIDKWVQEAFRKKPYGCKHPTHTYVACKAFEQGRNHAARPTTTTTETP